MCGHFAFDEDVDHPLLTQLPPALAVRWEDAVRGSPLEDVFRFILREVQEGRPGHEAVTRRLSEVLFVQAVRFWADSASDELGFLTAVSDRHLGAALSALHADPAAGWTVGLLARRAAMSRTAFAERFRGLLGETPYRYLTRWRMQHARRLLAESALSIERVALQTGYGSAASFSRVFKKEIGDAPGAWRRRVRAREQDS